MMANTVNLPPAAARSPYDFLTIRNASAVNFLEVYPDGTDLFLDDPDPTTPYLVIPPSDALTLQSNGSDAWASVSSQTITGMRYRGTYVDGETYYRGDVAIESDWTMVANKETIDSPAPRSGGDPSWQLPDVQPIGAVGRESVFIGNDFTFVESAFISGARFWVDADNVSAGMTWRLLFEDRTDPASPVSDWGASQVGVAGWNSVSLGEVPVPIGKVYRLAVLISGNAGGGGWSSPWNYLRSNEIPLSGEATHSTNGNTLLMNDLDANGTNRRTLLDLQDIGDEISAGGQAWSIISVDPQTGFVRFGVTPALRLPTEAQFTFSFVYNGVATIKYGATASHWVSPPSSLYTAQGLLQLPENTSPSFSTTGYGVDLELSPADVSSDWDPLAFSG